MRLSLDPVVPVLVGALVAIAGGLIFRVLEARQQRDHWYRDQLSIAAAQFLADATQYLKVCTDRSVCDIGAELIAALTAIEGADLALNLDLSRLQLAAPTRIYVKADHVAERLRKTFSEANRIEAGKGMTSNPQFMKAVEASAAARDEIDGFVQMVKVNLKRWSD
jgi:hypothetical protein